MHAIITIIDEVKHIMDETNSYQMDIAGYLNDLRDKKGWTIKQWEAMSGVSAQTISRILDGQTSPQFQTLAPLVRSAGGSLDELAGIQREATVIHDYTPQQHTSDLIANLEHNVQYLKDEKERSHGNDLDRIETLEGTIHKLRRANNVLIVALIILLIFISALVTWDLMDPRYGFLYRVISRHGDGGQLVNVFMHA